MWPPPSNSDHQSYHMNITFSVEESYTPAFATVTGRGPHPIYRYPSINAAVKILWPENIEDLLLVPYRLTLGEVKLHRIGNDVCQPPTIQ